MELTNNRGDRAPSRHLSSPNEDLSSRKAVIATLHNYKPLLRKVYNSLNMEKLNWCLPTVFILAD